MTEKTKEELLNEVWDEFKDKIKGAQLMEKSLWNEYNEKRKQIDEKFKGKCEVCGK